MAGSYTIVAAGASSRTTRGVIVSSTVPLAAGSQLIVAVGGTGVAAGGGSFVYRDCSTPILIAAGAGVADGAASSTSACAPGSLPGAGWSALCNSTFTGLIFGGVAGGYAGGCSTGAATSFDARNPPTGAATAVGFNPVGMNGYVSITLYVAPPPPAVPVATLVFDGSSSASAQFAFYNSSMTIATYVRHADAQSTTQMSDAGTLWELNEASRPCDGVRPLFAMGVNADRTAWLSCRSVRNARSQSIAVSQSSNAGLGFNMFDGRPGTSGAHGWTQPVVSIGDGRCPTLGPCAPNLEADVYANGMTVPEITVTGCALFPAASTLKLTFGGSACSGGGFVGSMTDVQLYGRSFSQWDVQDLSLVWISGKPFVADRLGVAQPPPYPSPLAPAIETPHPFASLPGLFALPWNSSSLWLANATGPMSDAKGSWPPAVFSGSSMPTNIRQYSDGFRTFTPVNLDGAGSITFNAPTPLAQPFSVFMFAGVLARIGGYVLKMVGNTTITIRSINGTHAEAASNTSQVAVWPSLLGRGGYDTPLWISLAITANAGTCTVYEQGDIIIHRMSCISSSSHHHLISHRCCGRCILRERCVHDSSGRGDSRGRIPRIFRTSRDVFEVLQRIRDLSDPLADALLCGSRGAAPASAPAAAAGALPAGASALPAAIHCTVPVPAPRAAEAPESAPVPPAEPAAGTPQASTTATAITIASTGSSERPQTSAAAAGIAIAAPIEISAAPATSG